MSIVDVSSKTYYQVTITEEQYNEVKQLTSLTLRQLRLKEITLLDCPPTIGEFVKDGDEYIAFNVDHHAPISYSK